MSKRHGVYAIINNVNLKMYVGKGVQNSDGTCDRWNDHMKSDWLIGRALRKYGVDGFTFGWLSVEPLTEQEALEVEVKQIAFWKTNVNVHGHDFGYNQTIGGDGGLTWAGFPRARLGKTDSDETRLKKSESQKNREFAPEHRRKLSAAKVGNRYATGKRGLEARKNMREAALKRHAREREDAT